MPRLAAFLMLLWASSAAVGGGDLDAANAEADGVHSNGKTALMAAARNGDNDKIRALMEQGADVNRPNNNGGTAIMYAALSGDPDTVNLLLDRGAAIDAVAANGWTALMIACVKGHADIARLLLDNGADPNRADVYAWTPLMRAVYEQRRDIVELLADDKRTRVNQPGENGITVLHLAAMKGDVEIVELLLRQGADPRARDNSGRTALDFTKEGDNPALLRAIRTAATDSP